MRASEGKRPGRPAAAPARIEKFRAMNLSRLSYSFAFIGLLYWLDLPLLLPAALIHAAFSVLWIVLLETEIVVEDRAWWSGYAPATADVVYVSMWVYLSGGAASFLMVGYFVSIALSSMTERRNYGLWTAAMSAACFSAIGVLIHLDWIPAINIFMEPVRPTLLALIVTLGLSCFSFFLVNRIVSSLFLQLHQEIAARTSAEERLLRDLQLARKVQESIIPTHDRLPASQQLSFGSFYLALESVGGDLYDVLEIDEHRFAFLIADVSGHGVPAALLTMMAKAIFARAVAAHPTDPAAVMRAVNRDMYSFIGDLRYYLTACYCLLDVSTGELKYCSAGHHPALVDRPGEIGDRPGSSQRLIELDSASTFFIGVEPDFPYESGVFQLEPGDRLLLFTDGMIEGRNQAGELYGQERFEQQIIQNRGVDASAVVRSLIADLESYLSDTEPEDDRAILCIDYRR